LTTILLYEHRPCKLFQRFLLQCPADGECSEAAASADCHRSCSDLHDLSWIDQIPLVNPHEASRKLLFDFVQLGIKRILLFVTDDDDFSLIAVKIVDCSNGKAKASVCISKNVHFAFLGFELGAHAPEHFREPFWFCWLDDVIQRIDFVPVKDIVGISSHKYNHQFWKKFRRAVKLANPNAIILAEHYGDPGEWLQGDEWDTIMNYDAFMEPITWFLTGMEKHSDEMRPELKGNADHFTGTMLHFMSAMLTPSLLVSMNELSNHDHSRFLTRTNRVVGRVERLGPEAANQFVNPAVMREAVAFQMTCVDLQIPTTGGLTHGGMKIRRCFPSTER